MPGNDLKSAIDEDSITTFLEKLISTLGVRRRYASVNPIVKENIQNLYMYLSDFLVNQGYLSFSEFHSHLMVNDEALTVEVQKTPPVGAFVFLMLEYNLKRIVFTNACETDSLKGLLGLLADSPENLRADPVGALADLAIAGIEVEPQGKSEQDTRAVEISVVTPEPEQTPSPDQEMNEAAAKPERDMPEEKTIAAKEQVPVWEDVEDQAPFPLSDGTQVVLHQSDIIGNDEDVDEEGHTRIMSRPKPEEVPSTAIRKQILQRPNGQRGTVHLVIIVRLGREIVDDAKVTVLTTPEVSGVTALQQGAGFHLLPGKFKLQVTYDKYSSHHDIELGEDIDEIQMDVNLLDATK